VARLSHSANSRLVDKRYYVPSPVEDWRAGKIHRENTERDIQRKVKTLPVPTRNVFLYQGLSDEAVEEMRSENQSH